MKLSAKRDPGSWWKRFHLDKGKGMKRGVIFMKKMPSAMLFRRCFCCSGAPSLSPTRTKKQLVFMGSPQVYISLSLSLSFSSSSSFSIHSHGYVSRSLHQFSTFSSMLLESPIPFSRYLVLSSSSKSPFLLELKINAFPGCPTKWVFSKCFEGLGNFGFYYRNVFYRKSQMGFVYTWHGKEFSS